MISEFPLFLFTLLGGMAAGAYALLAVSKRREDGRAWILPLLSLVLLAVSGLALMGHLGKPAGVPQVAAHPATGLGLEAYGACLFGLLVFVDLVVCLAKKKPNRAVTVLAGVFGLLLLCAMGYAYFELLGIPQWGTPASFAMLVLGGLALGVPLAALFVEDGYGNGRFRAIAMVALVLGTVALLAECGVFAGLGLGIAALACGAVLLAVALALVAALGRKAPAWLSWAVFVIVFVGMAVARYSFYVI